MEIMHMNVNRLRQMQTILFSAFLFMPTVLRIIQTIKVKLSLASISLVSSSCDA